LRYHVELRVRTPMGSDAAQKTLTVPEAGRLYFGLGRGASYEAARRGEPPVIRIGRP
jgi:hypothetical protein